MNMVSNSKAKVQVILDVIAAIRKRCAHEIHLDCARAETLRQANVHASTELHGGRISAAHEP